MGSSPTTTTVDAIEGEIYNFQDFIKKVKDGTVTIRILPPKSNKSLYHHTRVHKIPKCPICEVEKKLTEKQMANGAGGRKKRRYRSIDDEWQTS